MIIDSEAVPKSPTSPNASTPQAWAQVSLPISSENTQYYRSYSTFSDTASFTGSRAHTQRQTTAAASDVSRLLANTVPHSLSDDEQPPAYHDIDLSSSSTRSRGRFWTRCAAVLITLFLAYSTWFSYELVGISVLSHFTASNVSLRVSTPNPLQVLRRTMFQVPLLLPSRQGRDHCHPPRHQTHQCRHLSLRYLRTVTNLALPKYLLYSQKSAAPISVARGPIHSTQALNLLPRRTNPQITSCTPSPRSLHSISRLRRSAHQ